MTIMQIITNPDKLHRVADPIHDEGHRESIARDLIDTATHHLPTCIGLAAPQIGYNVRMFAMKDMQKNKFLTIINPEIVEATSAKANRAEGCLSVPGVSVCVERYMKIKVHYTDENGDRIERCFTNLNARIFQHELDHLNGVLIDG